MRHVACDEPAGTVIVPTSGSPRYMEFYQCLERVSVPAGTRLLFTKSAELAKAMNAAIAESVGAWIWLIGDDHTFPPDILLRLLSHRLPVVVPLTVQRHPPFGPVILRGEPGPTMHGISWTDVPVGEGLWMLPNDLHTGEAGMLVQRDVLDKVDPPIFRIGQITPDTLNEDIWLNQSLRALGYQTTIDLGARMGHLNAFAATPHVVGDVWNVVFLADGKPAFSAVGV